MTNIESALEMRQWIETCRELSPVRICYEFNADPILILFYVFNVSQESKIFICGSKSDLLEYGNEDCAKVCHEIAFALAKECSAIGDIFYTSAKDGAGVRALFSIVMDEISQYVESYDTSKASSSHSMLSRCSRGITKMTKKAWNQLPNFFSTSLPATNSEATGTFSQIPEVTGILARSTEL